MVCRRSMWGVALLLLMCAVEGGDGAVGTIKVATCAEGYDPMVVRSGDGSFIGFEVDQVGVSSPLQTLAAAVWKVANHTKSRRRAGGQAGLPLLFRISIVPHFKHASLMQRRATPLMAWSNTDARG